MESVCLQRADSCLLKLPPRRLPLRIRRVPAYCRNRDVGLNDEGTSSVSNLDPDNDFVLLSPSRISASSSDACMSPSCESRGFAPEQPDPGSPTFFGLPQGVQAPQGSGRRHPSNSHPPLLSFNSPTTWLQPRLNRRAGWLAASLESSSCSSTRSSKHDIAVSSTSGRSDMTPPLLPPLSPLRNVDSPPPLNQPVFQYDSFEDTAAPPRLLLPIPTVRVDAHPGSTSRSFTASFNVPIFHPITSVLASPELLLPKETHRDHDIHVTSESSEFF